MSNILGIYLGHDAGACLLQSGNISVMIEEERLNRSKHGRPEALAKLWPRFAGRYGYFPWASVTYCLRTAGIKFDDLDAVVVPAEWSSEGICNFLPILDPSQIILANAPSGGAHHLRHALSTFFASPFPHSAVLVVDDDGSVADGCYEAETGYVFPNREGAFDISFKNRYPRRRKVRLGLGWMYRTVSRILGFAKPGYDVADAGKTMGLAPYGRPRAELAEPWVRCEGSTLDFSGFDDWLRESPFLDVALENPGARPILSRDPLGRDQEPTEFACDLAFKVQQELELAMVTLAQHLQHTSGEKTLCLAGGVALNSVANEKVRQQTRFEDLFIQPAAGDGGQAIGLAYYGHLVLEGHRSGSSFPRRPSRARSVPEAPETARRPIWPAQHAYGGKRYAPQAVRLLLETSGLEFEEFGSADATADAAARDLAAHAIVAWHRGGSEYGPRALGHRSILANPTGDETKDVINARVKFREAFRPFAPSVLAERAQEVFELEGDSPFMLRVVPVRDRWKSRVPAITHVDGTARVQTVDRDACATYRKLILSFAKKTGVPLLLNTSFNLRGMPIVESPWDALHCFLYTDMDVLYIDDYRVPAPPPERLAFFRTAGWRFEIRRLGSEMIAATSPGASVLLFESFPHAPEVLASLDRSRSLAQCFAGFPDSEREQIQRGLQLLLRRGALGLRVGQLVFPVATGAETRLLPESLETLVNEAGMISARCVDV